VSNHGSGTFKEVETYKSFMKEMENREELYAIEGKYIIEEKLGLQKITKMRGGVNKKGGKEKSNLKTAAQRTNKGEKGKRWGEEKQKRRVE